MELISKLSWSIVTSLILLTSLTYQVKTNFKTLKLNHIIKNIVKKEHKTKISSFATLMVTLGGKIGVGSIAGVALAIYYGGVGSLFWLMLVSILCAVLSYVETILGMKYRIKNKNNYYGGPSYYISKGLNKKKLAVIYSLLIIFCYIGGFLEIQTNTITKSIQVFVGISPYIIGMILVIITSFCIVGGLKTISKVSEKLVPFMLILYLLLATFIFFKNINQIPTLITLLLKEAFKVTSIKGGLISTIIIGVQRGIFSTEVGIGTGSIVATTTTDNLKNKQAYMQVVGVYITGILVCGATAILILCSPYETLTFSDFNGIELVSFAFYYHFGQFGTYLLSFLIFLFSFSTILSGYYYGEVSMHFLFPKKYQKYLIILKIVTLINVFLGCFLSPTFLWKIVDWLVAIMIAINIYAMMKLKENL